MSRFRPLSTFAALAAATVLTAPAAHADVIGFDDLVGSGAFTSYSENGYTVAKTNGSSGCIASVFGNQVPSVFGGRVCDNKQNGHYSITSPAAFVFESIDLAANNGALTYFFTGLMGGVSLWSFQSELPSDTGVFHTVSSGSSVPIDTLELKLHSRQGSSFNFDNIAVSAVPSAVPEPASAALALVALGALGLARRRRRA
ncbi:MAG: PEP-CTERM sorting domain-containing protein [Rubrivivax sp.]